MFIMTVVLRSIVSVRKQIQCGLDAWAQSGQPPGKLRQPSFSLNDGDAQRGYLQHQAIVTPITDSGYLANTQLLDVSQLGAGLLFHPAE